MSLTTIVTLIGEIGVLLGVIVPVIISVRKISNGTKCQLRSEMLRIYYHNKDDGGSLWSVRLDGANDHPVRPEG